MEHQPASEAVQITQAVPVAGAGNERERTKRSLLEQMTVQPGTEAETQAAPAEAIETGDPQPVAEIAGEIAERGIAQPDPGTTGGTEPLRPSEAPASAVDAGSDAEQGDDSGGPAKSKIFRGRWDHLNEQERRVVELTTKRGLTLAEAYRAVFGAESGAAPANEPGQEGTRTAEDPVPDLERQIAAREQRVEELKRRKADAKNDLAAYDEATEAYLQARDELRALQEQQRNAVRQREAAATEAHRRAETVAEAALASEFPDALTEGTDLFEACAEELAYLREAQSPLMRDPEVKFKVARRMARALGYRRPAGAAPGRDNEGRAETNQTVPPAGTSEANTEAAAREAAPAAQRGAVAPRRTVRPLPSGGSPVEAPLTTLERRVAEARSSDAMLGLMREFGTPFEALLKR